MEAEVEVPFAWVAGTAASTVAWEVIATAVWVLAAEAWAGLGIEEVLMQREPIPAASFVVFPTAS